MNLTYARALGIVFVGLLAVPPHLPAQDDAAPARKNRRAGATTTASVWKVEGDKNTVYLAGSMHLLRAEDTPLPRPYARAFRDSARLVYEIAPDEEGTAKAAALSLEKGTYAGGKTLADEISKEAYRELGAFLKKSGMPADSFDKFRPWMGSMAITMVEMLKIGAVADFGVEKMLQDQAEAGGKEITGLETVEFQLGLFADMDLKLQERMLLDTVREAESMADEFPKMVAAWRSGDEKAFGEIAFDDLDDPEVRAFYEVILFGRNRTWLPKIEEFLKEDANVMVVVGAGHLMGEGSVIDLLRQNGHKVTQLKVRARRGGKPVPAPEPEEKQEKEKKKRELVPVLHTERAA